MIVAVVDDAVVVVIAVVVKFYSLKNSELESAFFNCAVVRFVVVVFKTV